MNKPAPQTLQDINTETMNQAVQALVKFGLAMADLNRKKQQRQSQKVAIADPIAF